MCKKQRKIKILFACFDLSFFGVWEVVGAEDFLFSVWLSQVSAQTLSRSCRSGVRPRKSYLFSQRRFKNACMSCRLTSWQHDWLPLSARSSAIGFFVQPRKSWARIFLGCAIRAMAQVADSAIRKMSWLDRFLLPRLFPQIAGSYRGSYFSMAGLLIAEIGCRCRLVSQACLPSWFRSWQPLPPCLPSLSLHDFALGSRCRLVSQACLPSWFRSWRPLRPCLASLSPFMISLLAAAAALSPKLVSLHDFALGGRCGLVSQACLPSWFRSWRPLWPCLASLSPFMISLLAAAAALSPKLVSLHDFALGGRCGLVSLHDFALGCRCRLVSQACFPSRFRSWQPPPCLPSLFPFVISLLAAAAALSSKLVVSLLEPPDSWMLWGSYFSIARVPDCGNWAVSQEFFPSWFCSWMSLPSPVISLPGLLLAAACRLVSQANISLLSWLSFSAMISLFCFGLLLTAALSCGLFLFVPFPSQLVLIGCRWHTYLGRKSFGAPRPLGASGSGRAWRLTEIFKSICLQKIQAYGL